MAFDPRGGPLTLSDYQALAERFIDAETAERQMLRRVNSLDGGALVGRNGAGNWAGIAIPNVFPGADYIREYRLRRDEPEVELGKVRRKYMQPAGRRALVYFPVGTDPGWLADPGMPLVITEGEFKAIALMRAAALHSARFFALGLAGVWNWKGKIGKELRPDGHWEDVTGFHPDLEKLRWDGRTVLIIFDSDIDVKDGVWWAQLGLARSLRERGAKVACFVWPPDAPVVAKGIDDLLAHWGAERVLEAITAAMAASGAPPDLVPYLNSDEGNAGRLVAMHGADLRLCPPMHKWFCWNARYWEPDARNEARKLMRGTIGVFLKQAKEQANEAALKFAHLSTNSKYITPALSFAGDDLCILPDELDRDDYLLNFRNGTVDLRTGVLRAHRRTDYITRMVDCDYKPDAQCPRFLLALDEIMGGGPDASEGDLEKAAEKVEFFHRAIGISATGDTRYKVTMMCHGGGDNGKTMLLSLIRDLLGPGYAGVIPLAVLTARFDDNATADARAKLRGLRFVMSSETEEGQRLNAASLKQICQGPGGMISARRLYESTISFRETHKLWIDANHPPELPASDQAVWNRLRIIPFTVKFSADRQDPLLLSKLMIEHEGIMAWIVRGAIASLAHGLPNSQTVSAATAGARETADRLKNYLDEFTLRDDSSEAYILNKDLIKDYHDWCHENKYPNLNHIQFNKRMTDLGYEQARPGGIRRWLKIRYLHP